MECQGPYPEPSQPLRGRGCGAAVLGRTGRLHHAICKTKGDAQVLTCENFDRLTSFRLIRVVSETAFKHNLGSRTVKTSRATCHTLSSRLVAASHYQEQARGWHPSSQKPSALAKCKWRTNLKRNDYTLRYLYSKRGFSPGSTQKSDRTSGAKDAQPQAPGRNRLLVPPSDSQETTEEAVSGWLRAPATPRSTSRICAPEDNG